MFAYADDYSFTEKELAAFNAETNAEWEAFNEAMSMAVNYAKIVESKSHCADRNTVIDFQLFQDAAEADILRNLAARRRSVANKNMCARK